MEVGLNDTEGGTARVRISVTSLLHRETKLPAKCKDLESRSRCKEAHRKNQHGTIVIGFRLSSLQLKDDSNVHIKRAHCSLTAKLKDNLAFLDHRVKERALQRA